MLIGYMRASTDSDRQVLDLQRDALLSAGVDERHRSRWAAEQNVPENIDGLRPLRAFADPSLQAA